MQQLLNEQHKRRMKINEESSSIQNINNSKVNNSSSNNNNNSINNSNSIELDSLVKKLKSKTSKESLKKPLRR